MADDSGEIVREAAEAGSYANVKAAAIAAEAASYYTAAGFAEHLANTQAMNAIRAAVVTRGTDRLIGSAGDLATEVAFAQVAGKNAGNTPPVTP